jgi:hypothetical protein
VERVKVPLIGRLSGLRGRLSSHLLASAFVLSYLVISVTVGVSLLTAPKAAGGDTAPAPGPPVESHDPPPTTTMTLPGTPGSSDDSGAEGLTPGAPEPPSTAPAGFKWVNGPSGLRTVIPEDWRSRPSTGPGAMQAVDPADTVRYVKYGGSTAPDIAIEPSHIRYENVFATRAADYRRITLSSAKYAGHEAVVWEFEHRENGAYLHVKSLYWRAAGTEFFVLAAGPAERWHEMLPIYDAMIGHASP